MVVPLEGVVKHLEMKLHVLAGDLVMFERQGPLCIEHRNNLLMCLKYIPHY